jgi:hypothetical protein
MISEKGIELDTFSARAERWAKCAHTKDEEERLAANLDLEDPGSDEAEELDGDDPGPDVDERLLAGVRQSLSALISADSRPRAWADTFMYTAANACPAGSTNRATEILRAHLLHCQYMMAEMAHLSTNQRKRIYERGMRVDSWRSRNLDHASCLALQRTIATRTHVFWVSVRECRYVPRRSRLSFAKQLRPRLIMRGSTKKRDDEQEGGQRHGRVGDADEQGLALPVDVVGHVATTAAAEEGKVMEERGCYETAAPEGDVGNASGVRTGRPPIEPGLVSSAAEGRTWHTHRYRLKSEVTKSRLTARYRPKNLLHRTCRSTEKTGPRATHQSRKKPKLMSTAR